MTRNDFDYYAMRAGQEDQCASIAACDEARERHQELANAYRFRCALLRPQATSERGGALADYGRRTRQAIASSSIAGLAPRPAIAAAPLLRA